jgi:AhpD family alkylhydroperoxidase
MMSVQSARRRQALAPEIESAFVEFSQRVFADGALSAKVKELIAVACAHVTQCPDCIRSHTHRAQRRGATDNEIMEAIWVAAEMRAGAAFAHSARAIEAMGSPRTEQPAPRAEQRATANIATTG